MINMMDHCIVAGISVGSAHLDKMVEFYSSVFGIVFAAVDCGDDQIVYEGRFADIDFALYSTVDESPGHGPIHFEFFFVDLEEAMRAALDHGGRTNGQPMEDDEVRAVGIFDPDENFMVFKQRK